MNLNCLFTWILPRAIQRITDFFYALKRIFRLFLFSNLFCFKSVKIILIPNLSLALYPCWVLLMVKWMVHIIFLGIQESKKYLKQSLTYTALRVNFGMYKMTEISWVINNKSLFEIKWNDFLLRLTHGIWFQRLLS